MFATSRFTELRRRWDPVSFAIGMIFLGVLSWSFVALRFGWLQSFSGPQGFAHGFRQAQTALTTRTLFRGGPFFRYETPAYGPPWSLPYEFPLYQWASATFARVFRLELIPASRWVSVLFFYASLIPFWHILRLLGIRRRSRVIFLSLLLVSPQYLYWSRSVMIESTALFLAMAYAYFALDFLAKPRGRSGVGLVIFGTLAILVKVFTFAGFAGLVAIPTLRALKQEWQRRGWRSAVRQLAPPVLFAFVVPLILGALWTIFCGKVRAANPYGATVIAANSWFFGTLSQRLAPHTWELFVFRTWYDVLGHAAWFPLIAMSTFLLKKNRGFCLACLACFLGVFLTFTNLHVEHNYYAYESGIFLIAALGFVIDEFLGMARLWKALALAVFSLCVLSCLMHFRENFLPVQSVDSNYFEGLGQVVANSSKPDEVVLVLGVNSSPEIPYYADRKGVVLPSIAVWRNSIIGKVVQSLSAEKIGAEVICGADPEEMAVANALRSRYQLGNKAVYEDRYCSVYGRL